MSVPLFLKRRTGKIRKKPRTSLYGQRDRVLYLGRPYQEKEKNFSTQRPYNADFTALLDVRMKGGNRKCDIYNVAM